jgi:hypothetical protein
MVYKRTYWNLRNTNVWLVWLLAIVLLIASGMVYRLVASHLELVVKAPISLPVPLEALPRRVHNWVGTDLPVRTTTREYMERHFADDFLSRRYIDSVLNTWVDVYVVYCSSQPAGILGHRPRVCYPAHGWVHDVTDRSQVTTRAGKPIDCLVHRFHKSAVTHQEVVVLNFYILNGQITADEDDFSGPLGRRPNFARDPARYVAQVQISSELEQSVRNAAQDISDKILDLLPGKDAEIKTNEDF